MPIAQPKTLEPDLGENPASNPRAVMGANEPPLEERIAMEFHDALLEERPDFVTRMETAIAAVARAIVTNDDGKLQLVSEDEETLGKAGDLDKILRACDGHISDTHKTVKQPYLDGGRAVDAEKNRLVHPITEARSKLRDGMNAFMAKREAARRAEEARIAAEQRAAQERAQAAEAERRRAEEAAAAAARDAEQAKRDGDAEALEAARLAEQNAAADARAAERRMENETFAAAQTATQAGPVRSDAGATISGKTVWNSAVEDYKKAFSAVSDDAKVREAIDAAVARLVRAGKREIKGCRVWSTVQAISR